MATSLNQDPGSIRPLESDRLSHYRTEHSFENYGEFTSPEEFLRHRAWAIERKTRLLILGNGSNILFKRRRVRSLVLKNRLPAVLTELGPDSIEVSSTVMVAQILKWCQERGLDSCYYLASVPATLGGAIAMNAGRGRKFQKSIFDFVVSVTFLDAGVERTLRREEIPIDYRQTPFTGQTDQLILRAVLKFPPKTEDEEGDPRRERVKFSKETQDHSQPNCGSVFRLYDVRILSRLKGRRISTASYSRKTLNWILSSGPRSWPIVWLIRLTRWIHRVIGQRCELEVIAVD